MRSEASRLKVICANAKSSGIFICFHSGIHLWHPGLNGRSFSKVTGKSETKRQGLRSHCFLLPCGANTVKHILWVNHEDSGVSSQIWGQLSSATLTLGELLVLLFLRLIWDILHRIVKIIWNNTWKAVQSLEQSELVVSDSYNNFSWLRAHEQCFFFFMGVVLHSDTDLISNSRDKILWEHWLGIRCHLCDCAKGFLWVELRFPQELAFHSSASSDQLST